MTWLWLILVLVVMMVAVIITQWHYLVTYRQRHRGLEQKLASIEAEKRMLDEMLSHSGDEQASQLIAQRADLIGQILAAGVSKDMNRSEAVLQEVDRMVSNREVFMHQTRLVYERWQPEMMNTLRERGLDDDELEICCLYALGLNGKSIQQYTQDSRHYQNVGVIRKKLGLGEHDKNIDGYIKSLLK